MVLTEVRMQDLKYIGTQRPRLHRRASITLRSPTQHLGGAHEDALRWMQHHSWLIKTLHRPLASLTLCLHQDRLYTLARRACGEILFEAVPKVPEGCSGGFWHFWHPVA
jgi:hypothetical protein